MSVRRLEKIRRQADFEICGEAENGKEAIEKAQELRPELIVLDLSMPIMNGLEAARILKQLMPGVTVIMFSDYSNIFSKQETRLPVFRLWCRSLNTSLT